MEKLNVAIADDNERMVQLLDEIVASDKDLQVVGTAKNGVEAYEIIKHKQPDVVLLDIVMPKLDGLALLEKVKKDKSIRKCPSFIIISAVGQDRITEDAFRKGASYYILKPFSARLLQVRLRNLIDNRLRLQSFFADKTSLRKEPIADLDKGFVEKLRALIDEQLGNSELSVEDLGDKIGMSRVQLYRKSKALTGYSPNELLRQMRLKKAASLLAASDMTIAEVAYEVGFSSPSYFTKCYKEQFGESPTDFLKRKG